MSIYKNAIDSIVIGVEDYKMAINGDTKRFISSTRNIFAGVLLLFKHRLSELSPVDSDEILIKKDIRPQKTTSGSIEWIGRGEKTVDVYGIKERFKDLGIQAQWNDIDKINKYRNNIEHYYSTESSDSVRGMIAICMVIIRDFMVNELKLEPKEEFGEEFWGYLLEVKEVYDKEKLECIEKLKELEWNTDIILNLVNEYECEHCSSGLISVNKDRLIYCKSCEEEYTQDELIENTLIYKFGSSYWHIKDGGEPPVTECLSCGKETFLIDKEQCQACGYIHSLTCDHCGTTFSSLSDLDDMGICHYCAHRYEKLMDE